MVDVGRFFVIIRSVYRLLERLLAGCIQCCEVTEMLSASWLDC